MINELTAQPSSINSRYILQAKLGGGASGNVYRVHDVVKNSELAMKLLLRFDPEGCLTFEREFHMVEALHHPNIIRYLELIRTHRFCFITMEWVRGAPFIESIRRRQGNHHCSVDFCRLRSAVDQLTDALQYLHQRGIVHCDLKPANILINESDRIVLIDFGLATTYPGPLSSGTTVGSTSGTLAYMSPQQLYGNESITPASDWYSLGVLLYECLTGELPIYIKGVSPPEPACVSPQTPPDLNELVMSLLSQEQAD